MLVSVYLDIILDFVVIDKPTHKLAIKINDYWITCWVQYFPQHISITYIPSTHLYKNVTLFSMECQLATCTLNNYNIVVVMLHMFHNNYSTLQRLISSFGAVFILNAWSSHAATGARKQRQIIIIFQKIWMNRFKTFGGKF